MIATSVDPNGHIFPLAFAIVKEEYIDSWFWFLIALRTYVTQRKGICLIFYRHVGINVVVRDVATRWTPPYAHHRYCLRHVVSNFNDKYKNKVLKHLAYKAGCQHQPCKYEKCMEEIKRLNDKSVEWYAKMDNKKWTQAYYGGFRYVLMTTNIVECINGVLKRARMLLITALVHATVYQCVTYFENHRVDIWAQIANGDMYITYAMTKVTNYEAKASRHFVRIFDQETEMFDVTTTVHGFHMDKRDNKQVVNLKDCKCTCNK